VLNMWLLLLVTFILCNFHATLTLCRPMTLNCALHYSNFVNYALCNFGLFLSKFGFHGNFLGFLENLGSIFQFADPKKPTIHVKIVSITCTEMKLCLSEWAYLQHSGYRQFSRFLRKIVEFVKKN